MNKIVYPISLNYREHWGEWEMIREFIQNALRATNSYQMYHDKNDLIIRDYGEGFSEENLLFGEGRFDKKFHPFHEGMKIALVIALRLGYKVTIHTNNLIIKTKTNSLFNKEVLELQWGKTNNPIQGTEIRIHGYKGKDYSRNFILQNDERILFGRERFEGDLNFILNDPNKLYVHHIFVSDLEDAKFGYDLSEVRLEESRKIPNIFDVKYEVAFLWSQVEDYNLLKQLFEAIKDGKFEAKANWQFDFKNQEVASKAFHDVFGEKIVLYTDAKMAKAAEWRYANIIRLTVDPFFLNPFKKLCKTDAEYVKEWEESNERFASDLTPRQQSTLNYLRKLAKQISPELIIQPYEMPSALGRIVKNEIRIRKDLLNNRFEAVKTLIHELAHFEGKTEDLTHELIRAMEIVAAKLIVKPKYLREVQIKLKE